MVQKETFTDALFNRYSVITQFAKLAAGEQLCRRCTHRKLYHFKTFKKFSLEKLQILSCDTVAAKERYIISTHLVSTVQS